MSFVQIVGVSTTRLDEFGRLHDEWFAATEGRRTLLREALYADRSAPNRYVSINEFDSYESAMVNSGLPETSALAEEAGRLCDEEPTFTDLELVDAVADLRVELADKLARYLETNEEIPGLFADDVVLEMNVPLWRFQLAGAGAMTEMLRGDAPYGRRFEELNWSPIPGGFLQRWAWRTNDGDGYSSHYSRGISVMELSGTRIGRITVHCSGDWDPATEERQGREAPMVDDVPRPVLS
jgi:hypothetical protein